MTVSGVVVAGIAPGGDGVGTLYVGISSAVDCFDGSSQGIDIIANADLSQLGNEVPFSIEFNPEGIANGWILQVFLDDDNDAVFETPDAGDMTLIPTGFEELAGCPDLPALDDDVGGLIVTLDNIVG